MQARLEPRMGAVPGRLQLKFMAAEARQEATRENCRSLSLARLNKAAMMSAIYAQIGFRRNTGPACVSSSATSCPAAGDASVKERAGGGTNEK